jgi:glycosyltransferase involved in cell wall biosynthesis
MRTDAASVRHYGPGGRENGGGIGRLIGYVVDDARRRGADHAVRDTRGPSWSAVRSAGYFGSAILGLAADGLVARRRIHHIHFAGRGSTLRKLILAWVARTLGCRHILHLHDYDYAADYGRRPDWQKRRVRAMVTGADGVIVLGQRDRDTVVDVLGASPARVTILHNCVRDPGVEPRIPGVKVRLLFLGKLSERKGVSDLLEALAAPALAGLAWHAVLAGDGPIEDYRALASRLGVSGRVAFPGWLDERATHVLCRNSDILVLPSHAEGMAMAVLEGLAHGLAVVTTRVGAHEEVITHGVNGLFVPVGDPASLAGTLAALVTDASRRDALGRCGRKLFLARFNIAAYGARLQSIYGSLQAPALDRLADDGVHQ